jgi:SOS-response transcriptional repressor LexA
MGRPAKEISAIGARILSLFEKGESRLAFSRRVGVDLKTLSRYIRGERQPSAEFLNRLADEAGVDVTWLLRGGDRPAIWSKESEQNFSRGLAIAVEVADPAGVLIARDSALAPGALPILPTTWPTRGKPVPVFGTVAGSVVGQIAISSDPVGTMPRPPGLLPDENAYVLTVRGSSMEPRFMPGDHVFVAPNRARRPGDIVVVQTINHEADDVRATIKELIADRASILVTRQYNPPAEVAFKRAQIVSVHRVLTINELLGV